MSTLDLAWKKIRSGILDPGLTSRIRNTAFYYICGSFSKLVFTDQETHGYVGADLSALVGVAAMSAREVGKATIGQIGMNKTFLAQYFQE